jgi:hypothetical protein
MQNKLLIGNADKTAQLLQVPPGFLLIDDGQIADAFLAHFARAKLFDVAEHSFNPLKGIDYKRARDFAAAVYTASPQGENTLTVRNGKRAMVKALLDNPSRLDRLKTDNEEVVATIDDLLLSPVLRQVLCNPTNFSFKGSVVARLDRAILGDFDAFVLASLLIGQSQGQIIIPDFGFYGRPLHMSLIRQNRLTAGVRTLSQLSKELQQELLTFPNKMALGCTYEDAVAFAEALGIQNNPLQQSTYQAEISGFMGL